MKTIFVIVAIILTNTVVRSQIIKAEISNWITFECGFTEDYNTIIKDTSLQVLGHGFGDNTLTFDLKQNTYKFYFLDDEFSSGTMEWKLKSGVYIFTCKTIDRKTNEAMDLFVTIDTNPSRSKEPYVSQFYSDVNTNKSYGMISYFE
jgi:hypothetical protein